MNSGLSDVLNVALPAILLGLVALSLMVHRELGPFGGLSGGGKWMLIGALGMGIFAFALKMAVAVAMAKRPERTIEPLVATYSQQRARASGRADPGMASRPAGGDRRTPYVWQALPAQAPAPLDNPSTPEKVALGERLFFEKRLSADGTVSCNSCHLLFEKAGSDGRRTAAGIRGEIGPRNTPTVWNAAFQSVLFWDGRARSLEEQAKGPILNPVEMALPSAAEAERRLSADPSYRAAFARAFGDDAITFERIAMALAAFERTLVTADTPYDRFVRGDGNALSPAQRRGMALFESLGCILCHRGPAFSDASLIGGEAPLRLFPANATPLAERHDLTADGGADTRGGRPGVWRIPSLRNVALTGPYFHNGSVDRLEDAVRIMAEAQLGRSGNLVVRLDRRQTLHVSDRSPLSDDDVRDIVAFLNALSSDSLLPRATGRTAEAPR